MNGLPPHIAQVICGHRDISTTMGYKAIYPAEAIEAHRAFIARRRQARPSEEYRTPTEEEWDAVPRPLRKTQAVHRHLRPRLRHAVHPRARLHQVLAPAARPRPARPARGDPRQPARPHRRSRTRGLARRDRGTEGQPRRRRRQAHPDRHGPAASSHHRPARHARIPRHRGPLRPARTGRKPVTTMHPCRPRAALRACACGIHPFETGTGLPIDCGTWLHREDFTSHFITPAPAPAGTSISDRASISNSVTVPAPTGKPPSPPSAPASSRPAAGNGGCSSWPPAPPAESRQPLRHTAPHRQHHRPRDQACGSRNGQTASKRLVQRSRHLLPAAAPRPGRTPPG